MLCEYWLVTKEDIVNILGFILNHFSDKTIEQSVSAHDTLYY